MINQIAFCAIQEQPNYKPQAKKVKIIGIYKFNVRRVVLKVRCVLNMSVSRLDMFEGHHPFKVPAMIDTARRCFLLLSSEEKVAWRNNKTKVQLAVILARTKCWYTCSVELLVSRNHCSQTFNYNSLTFILIYVSLFCVMADDCRLAKLLLPMTWLTLKFCKSIIVSLPLLTRLNKNNKK